MATKREEEDKDRICVFFKFHIYVLVYCNGLYLSGLDLVHWEDLEGAGGEGGGRGDRDGEHM